MSKKIEKSIHKLYSCIIPIYIIFNIFYILIGSYLVKIRTINFELFSKGYIYLFILNFIISILLVYKKKYKRNQIDKFLILIIIFAIISTVFAYDSSKALYGEYARNEGLFVILYYISILFISSFVKKEHRKLIVYSILIFGFIQLFYSTIQKFYFGNLMMFLKNRKISVTGFTTNPNFFGTLMLICISYSIGLYIDSNNKLEKILFLILGNMFFIGILHSNTLSSLVGLIFIMIFLFIYCIMNKKIKKYIILVIILLSTLFIEQYFNMTTLVNDFVKTQTETTNIVKGEINDNYGTGRMEVWKKTIKIIPKHILHGVGIDNFINVLDGNPIRNKKVVFDKAHNEYLQILVTMGIFSLFSYLCLHFFIVKNGIINSLKTKEIFLLIPIIGYIIQAQFNISVIEVAPLFYIGMGLLVDRNQ